MSFAIDSEQVSLCSAETEDKLGQKQTQSHLDSDKQPFFKHLFI